VERKTGEQIETGCEQTGREQKQVTRTQRRQAEGPQSLSLSLPELVELPEMQVYPILGL
jgi:hypothetical protein